MGQSILYSVRNRYSNVIQGGYFCENRCTISLSVVLSELDMTMLSRPEAEEGVSLFNAILKKPLLISLLAALKKALQTERFFV